MISQCVLSISPWSLSDKIWEEATDCPFLSMLNNGKNLSRSDKTVILKTLTHWLNDASPYRHGCVILLGSVKIAGVQVKNIRHFRYFWRLGPNIWREISQIYKEFIKPIRQMSDEPWKFFARLVAEISSLELTMQHALWCFHGCQ